MTGAASSEAERLAAIAALLRSVETPPAPAAPALQLADQMIDAARVPKRHREALSKLTPTEIACMRFLGWGRSNADIATLLVMSENTVRVHMGNIARKLQLDGARELAALAGLLFYSAE